MTTTTGYWCPMCKALVEPEWRSIAGVELAMHRHGDSWHGVHRAETDSWGDDRTVTSVYELVVRENGQFKTIEPGEVIS